MGYGLPGDELQLAAGRCDIVPSINASNPTHSIAVPDPPVRPD
jgi:hypothetical protein